MDRTRAEALLEAVADGSLDPADALDQLATAPYDALAHSLVDLVGTPLVAVPTSVGYGASFGGTPPCSRCSTPARPG